MEVISDSKGDSDCGGGKAPAMSEPEKQVLLDLVDEFKLILEDKRTDFGTTSKKSKAWRSVADRFCSSPGTTYRTEEQLKTWWSNCKKRAKKQVATNKRCIIKTGGGKGKNKLNMEMDRVMGIIPGQMKSLENLFDDDAEIAVIDGVETIDLPEHEKIIASPPKKKSKSLEQESRKQKDARSSLTDMEYEEHRMRMKILARARNSYYFKNKGRS
ncbi:Myb/SANT-like DNA-binding domain-containing protein 3 [Folsomia candida]|uniref:Regulatory protein zeste n=1 Tax=Folsomia candida TaxID=158441 RepID=A0A226DE69_FOLCA|nr:Myb/SANT-like DNA-binding domain-containing protein 3 [Folsomia candida]